MTKRNTLSWFLLLAIVAAGGCGKLSSSDDGGTAGDGDGDGDGGDGDDSPPPQGKTIECGGNECEATAEEVKWGADPCCLPDDVCGLESDYPSVIIPDLLGTGEMIIPVSELIAMFAGGDAGVDTGGTTEPVVNCMPKDQEGDPSVDCPGADLQMGAGGMLPDGLPGGGMDEDAGMSMTDGGMMAAFEGCCRPDGFCGYLDTNTGFGCVKITESIIGMVNGAEDVTCGN